MTAIAEATGLSIGDARAAIARLETGGYLARRSLGGWERVLDVPIVPGP